VARRGHRRLSEGRPLALDLQARVAATAAEARLRRGLTLARRKDGGARGRGIFVDVKTSILGRKRSERSPPRRRSPLRDARPRTAPTVQEPTTASTSPHADLTAASVQSRANGEGRDADVEPRDPVDQRDPSGAIITMSRTGALGHLRVYIVRLFRDGLVSYDGKESVYEWELGRSTSIRRRLLVCSLAHG
jgi:hypothetical protein